MISMWYIEAGKYNVLPIDSRGVIRMAEERPQIAPSRSRYVLYPRTQSITAASAPKILNRPYSINADIELTAECSGVPSSMGGNDGGITLYVKDGLLCYAHNYVAKQTFTVHLRNAYPPAGTSCRSSSRQRVNRMSRTAKELQAP